jgi:hypothetical protein
MPNPYHFIAHHPNVEFVRRQQCLSEHRLLVAEDDVVFYRKRAEYWRNAEKKAVSTALFDLMNSGISHRRYLKFIRSLEA